MLEFIATVGIVLVVVIALLFFSGMVRYISNDRIGVVEKLWSTGGSLKEGFIALKGEAGYQPDVLRGGFQFFKPFQYKVHSFDLVTIPQGQIGYVFARDGVTLAPSQALASNVKVKNFENARSFLTEGGQKGPQRQLLREGTYSINMALFIVLTAERVYALTLSKQEEKMIQDMKSDIVARQGFTPIVIKDNDDQIGIVTIHDGPGLPQGEIIAPTVGEDPAKAEHFHNNFQEPDRFLAAGGFKGRQYQVLLDGSYYINRLFATVELIDKTVVDVGSVGVVISYTGSLGSDVSGEKYTHGELVPNGCRGVWQTPMLPGKYAFNTYAGDMVIVPTVNFILKWSNEMTKDHRFDENLSEVSLITLDAFEPSLPLSVVVHIDYKKAPLVIQRFGDVKRLVEQTLDPMVAAYFKNIGQTKTLIQLLQDRSAIQKKSSEEMRAKFADYSLELLEVLIGTPHAGPGQGADAIDKILTQLRDRQVAREQIETYQLQEKASVQERSLKEAQASANMQTQITQSKLSVQVQNNEGEAELAKARQQALVVTVTAEATSQKSSLEGEGEAKRIRAIGLAQAEATEKQVQAYQGEGAQYQVVEKLGVALAKAIENGKIPLVPQIQLGGDSGNGSNGGNGFANTITAMLMSKELGLPLGGVSSAASKDSTGGAGAEVNAPAAATATPSLPAAAPDASSKLSGHKASKRSYDQSSQQGPGSESSGSSKGSV